MPHGYLQQGLTEACRCRDRWDKENVTDALGKPEDSMHACLTVLVLIMAFTGGHDADQVCWGFISSGSRLVRRNPNQLHRLLLDVAPDLRI